MKCYVQTTTEMLMNEPIVVISPFVTVFYLQRKVCGCQKMSPQNNWNKIRCQVPAQTEERQGLSCRDIKGDQDVRNSGHPSATDQHDRSV